MRSSSLLRRSITITKAKRDPIDHTFVLAFRPAVHPEICLHVALPICMFVTNELERRMFLMREWMRALLSESAQLEPHEM